MRGKVRINKKALTFFPNVLSCPGAINFRPKPRYEMASASYAIEPYDSTLALSIAIGSVNLIQPRICSKDLSSCKVFYIDQWVHILSKPLWQPKYQTNLYDCDAVHTNFTCRPT